MNARMIRAFATSLLVCGAAGASCLAAPAGTGPPAEKPARRRESKAAPPLRICMLSGSLEYRSDETLPPFARDLEARYNAACTVLKRRAADDLPGLEALDRCDVMLLFTRRMKLRGEQLERVKRYCLSGRPIVGVRTASHAFQTWLALDREVLGGNYQGHYGSGPITRVRIDPAAAHHPILAGVESFTSVASLYKNTPIAPDATRLLTGEIPGHTEPVAWVRTYRGARIFYTSLGHPEDFKDPSFRRMLANALFWVARREPEPPSTKDQPLPRERGLSP